MCLALDEGKWLDKRLDSCSPLSRELQVRHEDVHSSFNPHRLLVSESQNQLQPLPNDHAHLGMNGGLLLFQIVRAMPQAPLGCRS